MATLQIRHLVFVVGIVIIVTGIALMESVSTGFRILYMIGCLSSSFSFYKILFKDKTLSTKILAGVLVVATILFGSFY